MAKPTIKLSNLNGTNGFKINGIDEGNYSGRSVFSIGNGVDLKWNKRLLRMI
tara:strand:- start:45 stop:200 length:156 start_codon:yes stop_codon:yes gene_type:complete